MTLSLNGTIPLPAQYGGYLTVYMDGQEFYITSVPSFVANAPRYHDSIVENLDHVQDDDGNIFDIRVLSSNLGVDWNIQIQSKQADELKQRINVEYLANEY